MVYPKEQNLIPCLPFLGKMLSPGIQKEIVKEKKYSVMLVKDGEADFIQNRHDSYRDHGNWIL